MFSFATTNGLMHDEWVQEKSSDNLCWFTHNRAFYRVSHCLIQKFYRDNISSIIEGAWQAFHKGFTPRKIKNEDLRSHLKVIFQNLLGPCVCKWHFKISLHGINKKVETNSFMNDITLLFLCLANISKTYDFDLKCELTVTWTVST